jgi:hypothetical protein
MFLAYLFTSPSKSVYFLTPFKSGEIVFTTNGHYRELESGDLSLRVLKEASPQEFLDAHTHPTRAFLETGSRAEKRLHDCFIGTLPFKP